MSRNRRRQRAAVEERRQRILEAPADLSVVAVREYLKRASTASEEEVLALGEALSGFLDGQEVDPQVAAKMRAKVASMKKAEGDFLTDRQRFVDETFDRGMKKAAIGSKKEAVEARVAGELQSAVQGARALRQTKRLWVLDQIKNGPKEIVNVPPRVVTYSTGEGPIQRVEGEEISLLGVTVRIPTGEQMVPAVIANRLREIWRSRAETEQRKGAMRKNMEVEILNATMTGIDNEFGSRSVRAVESESKPVV